MGTGHEPNFDYRPLYMQVKDSLVRRLIDGAWQPGQLIPSEMELAREVGVSQGTIRKALDAMTTDNLLLRRQGRGTFVAAPEEGNLLFRFFRMANDDGTRVMPDSRILSRGASTAKDDVADALGIAAGDQVFVVERMRLADNKPIIAETIVVASHRFAGFDKVDELPNNVYRLYSERWGMTISRAKEKLKAVAASVADAATLGCALGEPLLEITRIAYDLEDNAVEYRSSRCLTDGFHYSSVIG
ncbi:MAG: GntR family transcriptional regulator [Mesorhizobium sp.]